MYRITAGIDPETGSRSVVEWLLHWHGAAAAHITLVTAFDPLVDDPVEDAEFLRAQAQLIATALPDAVVDTSLAERSIPNAIGDRGHDSDLVVIGSRRGPGGAVLANRLPVAIARRVDCPTVIVPDGAPLRSGSILVGLDDDGSSDAALDWAAAEAAAVGAELQVVHAWSEETVPLELVHLLDDPGGLRAAHDGHLADAAARLRERDVPVREQLSEDSALSAILHLAPQAGLVVVGSHRRGQFGEWVFGSTAAELIRECREPVCIVPPTALDAAVALTRSARRASA